MTDQAQRAAAPLVSVVVPCLNRVTMIGPTLESILGQDYPHVECVVVDAGSTDGTLDVLRRHGDAIRWVSEPDDGHADAINKGFRMARGDVLAWLNADDLWAVPGAVSAAVEYLVAHPEVDLVYGDCGEIDLAGHHVGMSYSHAWDLAYAVEHCDHCIPQPAAFMRRAILERVGYLDTAFVSKKDHELWLRIGLLGTIRHVPELLAHARSGGGYLDHRGDITADACVRLTEKFFRQPGVPDALRARRARALSNAHLVGARYAVQYGGHHRVAAEHVVQALRCDPTNLRACLGVSRRLIRQSLPLGAGA